MSEKNGNVPYVESELYRIRHSAAHVMAEAVLSFFPEAKLAIGPPIEDGFYYDFDLGKDENGKSITFSPEDLENIEGKLKQLLKQNAKFEQSSMSVADAKEFFASEPYKLELIDELAAGKVDENGNPISEPVSQVGIYQHRDFVDLCRGPHVGFTKQVKANAVKILRSSGAYWRGDENRQQLQRIYGTAWHNRVELDDYLKRLEEAKKRDHRKLGKELDLFSTSPEVGGGLILWHPKGGLVRHLAEEFCKNEHLANGYDMVYSPHIGRSTLWKTSGHLTWYKDDMYSAIEIDEDEYFLKPMNCPFHIMIYKDKMHSYRDLPLRLAEWGTVYRYERSGVMHGLMRVRGFTQDDAHLFCRKDQMPEEIDRALNFCLHILRSFGMDKFHAYLSTRDEAKSAGDAERWGDATEALRAALDRAELDYDIDEGGAAFYGPKIDLKMIDALGREWQLSTIQFDFNLPERFEMTYIGQDGEAHQPYMIHRALLGSMERFMGVLIEHYAGAFPLWLAPVQVEMIPIADRHIPYAEEVAEALRAAGLRVEVDGGNERMNKKIRNAQLQKVPYMLVVGDKEVESGVVAVRTRDNEDRGNMSVADFKAHALKLLESKSLIL
ncbi:MAG: threonine--tRNA ligase [Ardenticatenaceae bacterium]|nr:threonine--tRNA ligase [Anaerolineales bacterium]MCB8923923.1 threonine--tRNA ligase [Ardenticatenaceae bacterium]MCB9004386.1 threonine--tRNA ligase [Ardenticatenaceae bacterium]